MTIRKTEINEKSQAVVEFSFDAAAIEAEKAKVFRKKANSFNVPGFRRGKAPRSVIEKMYGTGIFLEEFHNFISIAKTIIKFMRQLFKQLSRNNCKVWIS